MILDKRYFDNVLDGTAREVKSGPVTLSKYKAQILKDIEILNQNLTAGQISKVEWHCFDDVELSGIEKFIEDNLSKELKGKKVFQIILLFEMFRRESRSTDKKGLQSVVELPQ